MVSNLMKENSSTKALFPLQRIRQREVQLSDGNIFFRILIYIAIECVVFTLLGKKL